MTPAERCKQLTGLQLASVAELTGISHRQLSKWHYSKPHQFRISMIENGKIEMFLEHASVDTDWYDIETGYWAF